MILPRGAWRSPGEPLDADFQQVQAAVLRECVVNLARVKEYVAQNVGGTLDAAGFDNWQDLMRGIQAGLLMLGKTRAVQCIERVTGHLKRVMQQGGSGCRAAGAGSACRCHRQHRVLHGDAAGRALRSLVHARQRRGCAGGAWMRSPCAGGAHRAADGRGQLRARRCASSRRSRRPRSMTDAAPTAAARPRRRCWRRRRTHRAARWPRPPIRN